MAFECDCGARYESSAAVLACQAGRHGLVGGRPPIDWPAFLERLELAERREIQDGIEYCRSVQLDGAQPLKRRGTARNVALMLRHQRQRARDQ